MTDSLCLFPIWKEIYHPIFPQTVANGFSSEEVLDTYVSHHPSFQIQGDGRVIRRKYRLGVTSHFGDFFGFLFDSMLKAVKSEDVQHRKQNCSILSVHE